MGKKSARAFRILINSKLGYVKKTPWDDDIAYTNEKDLPYHEFTDIRWYGDDLILQNRVGSEIIIPKHEIKSLMKFLVEL